MGERHHVGKARADAGPAAREEAVSIWANVIMWALAKGLLGCPAMGARTALISAGVGPRKGVSNPGV